MTSDDTALLAEVAAHRALRPLEPRLLAPTVMASAKPVADTVRLLREAGYCPVQHDKSGAVIVERAATRRAGDRPEFRDIYRPPPPAVSDQAPAPDVRELARALVAAARRGSHDSAPGAGRPGSGQGTPRERLAAATTSAEQLSAMAARLSADEVAQLAHAVDTGGAVAIDYVDNNGRLTHRVVSACVLEAPFLEAWCHLRNDERVFTVSKIQGVSPA